MFGGTFDPPHVGHLVTAVNVRHRLRLDRVLLVVANVPWQKEGTRPITPAADRLWLVEEAVRGVAGLEASRIELDRGGRSYTADTLDELVRRHPTAQLFTILGEDAAAAFLSWERYGEVAAHSSLVVVDRPGFVADLPGGFDWVHVEVPHLEVSSTDLRARALDGRPLDFLLPPAVIAAIRSQEPLRRGCVVTERDVTIEAGTGAVDDDATVGEGTDAVGEATEAVAEGSEVAPPPPPVTHPDATGVLDGEPTATPVSDEVADVETGDEVADVETGDKVVDQVAVVDEVRSSTSTVVDEVADGDELVVAPSRRSRRKRHRRRTRPTRTALMALVAVAVAVALPLLGVVAARTIANSREGRAVVVDVPLRQLPSTPASLVVGVDDQGRPASLTVLSVAADGQGGTVVVLPLATAAFLDGPAVPVRLDTAWDRGGLDGQTQGVESVLGVSTAVSQALDEDGLTQLFEPYAPIELDLELPVLDTDAEGATEELFPAGPVELTARDMARLLLARVDGESELARLARTEALWNAVTARGQTATTTTLAPGHLAGDTGRRGRLPRQGGHRAQRRPPPPGRAFVRPERPLGTGAVPGRRALPPAAGGVGHARGGVAIERQHLLPGRQPAR